MRAVCPTDASLPRRRPRRHPPPGRPLESGAPRDPGWLGRRGRGRAVWGAPGAAARPLPAPARRGTDGGVDRVFGVLEAGLRRVRAIALRSGWLAVVPVLAFLGPYAAGIGMDPDAFFQAEARPGVPDRVPWSGLLGLALARVAEGASAFAVSAVWFRQVKGSETGPPGGPGVEPPPAQAGPVRLAGIALRLAGVGAMALAAPWVPLGVFAAGLAGGWLPSDATWVLLVGGGAAGVAGTGTGLAWALGYGLVWPVAVFEGRSWRDAVAESRRRCIGLRGSIGASIAALSTVALALGAVATGLLPPPPDPNRTGPGRWIGAELLHAGLSHGALHLTLLWAAGVAVEWYERTSVRPPSEASGPA